MSDASMRLKVLLPSEVFADVRRVSRIVAQTRQGSVGFWPHRLDCASALSRGILSYHSDAGEAFIAVDAGVLVKTGADVTVSVRRAIGGTDLARLRETVEHEFATVDTEQRSARAAMAHVEAELMRRLVTLRDG
jgi:F-type H+-transporting ATPase subunit epsilon